MPGFLDAAGYSGETEIDLGHGYWVRVKNCLTSEEYARVQQLLGNGRAALRIDGGGPSIVNIDLPAAMREMLAGSVTAWNLDDPDGTPWPLEPDKAKRASIARLPYPVLQQVYERCDELNSPRRGREAAQFRDEADGGDPDGDGGAAGTVGVPRRQGVLAAGRVDPGVPPLAAPPAG